MVTKIKKYYVTGKEFSSGDFLKGKGEESISGRNRAASKKM
jgi:hypothetical protein